MTTWNVEAMTGYKPFTTFWGDFEIADAFGVAAIKDTFKRAFSEWKDNYKYLTELVMVLNHRSWLYAGKDQEYCMLYFELWEKADLYACENLKDEEAMYYFRVTD